MKISAALASRRNAILNGWCNLVFAGYPADTAERLKKEKDRFLNPVGYNITRELGIVLDGVMQGLSVESLRSPLTNIIKIRAVQAFSPSEAVKFVILLKRAIEEVFTGESGWDAATAESVALYSKIDDLVLLSLDIYVECREKVHQIALSEVRKQREEALSLLRRFEYNKASESSGPSEVLERRVD